MAHIATNPDTAIDYHIAIKSILMTPIFNLLISNNI